MFKPTDLVPHPDCALGRCLVYICDVLAARAEQQQANDDLGVASTLPTAAQQSEQGENGKAPDQLSNASGQLPPAKEQELNNLPMLLGQ